MSDNPYHPFRRDEIVEYSFRNKKTGEEVKSYRPTIGGRQRVARETLKNLVTQSELLKFSTEGGSLTYAVVKATAVWDGGAESDARSVAEGLGTSFAIKEKEFLKSKFVELAETRAIHRALAAAGIGVGHYGAEEFDEDDQEPPTRRRDADDNAARERETERRDERKGPFGWDDAERHVADGERIREEQRSSPKTEDDYRIKVEDQLVKWFTVDDKLDKAEARRALAYLIGKESPTNLTDFEAEKAWSAIVLLKSVDKDGDKAKRKVADAKLPWFDQMTKEDFKIWKNLEGGGDRGTVKPDTAGKKKDPF